MFPISVGATYETVLAADKGEALLSRLESELAREGATNIHQLDNKITFRGRLFRRRRLDFISIAEQGEIDVLSGTPIRLHYRLDCVRMFLWYTAMTVVVSAAAIWFCTFAVYLVPGSFCLLMFVLNYLTAWIRFRSFIKHVVEGVG